MTLSIHIRETNNRRSEYRQTKTTRPSNPKNNMIQDTRNKMVLKDTVRGINIVNMKTCATWNHAGG